MTIEIPGYMAKEMGLKIDYINNGRAFIKVPASKLGKLVADIFSYDIKSGGNLSNLTIWND